MAAYTRTLQYELGRLSKTLDAKGVPTLSEQGAANVWIGKTGYGLQACLNFKCGINNTAQYFAIRRACNQIAGTVNEDPGYALSQVATPAVTGQQAQTPDAEWTKAEIIAWLQDHGVTLSQSALNNLTKAELLALVDDLTDNEEEP